MNKPQYLTPSPREQIQCLQFFRGLAAIGVLLYHIQCISHVKFQVDFANNWFASGHLGVNFFFVLSGFIIFFAHEIDLGNVSKLPRYLLKRFFRVWPLLAIITFLKFIYIVVSNGQGVGAGKDSFDIIFSSFFMLPVPGGKPLLDVAWTLSHEILFYLFFSLGIIYNRKLLICSCLVWLSAIMFCAFVQVKSLSILPSFLFNPLNVQFMIGCLVCWLGRKVNFELAFRTAFFLGIFTFLIGLYVDVDEWKSSLAVSTYWGVVFALLIYGAVGLEKKYSYKLPAFFIFPGHASYSIYLVHSSVQVPAIMIASRHFDHSEIYWQVILWFIAGISFLFGILTFCTIEKYILKNSKLWISKLTSSNNLQHNI